MLKYPILLIAWLVPCTAGAVTLRETLTAKLSEYCIPKTSCADTEAATYKSAAASSNKCECPCADQYYNATARTCEICDAGTSGRYATSCGPTSCSVGFELVEVRNDGACLAGFEAVAEVTSCGAGLELKASPQWSCDTGFGTSSCEPGYELI
jgi:hypothetical protein